MWMAISMACFCIIIAVAHVTILCSSVAWIAFTEISVALQRRSFAFFMHYMTTVELLSIIFITCKIESTVATSVESQNFSTSMQSRVPFMNLSVLHSTFPVYSTL